VGSCVYRKKHSDLQPWVRAVCTLPAVPRSTQPSTLRGTVKEYQLSGLVLTNNKWRWWLLTTAAYRRTHMQSQVAWSEGRRPLGAVLHSSNEPSELLQWPSRFCPDGEWLILAYSRFRYIRPRQVSVCLMNL